MHREDEDGRARRGLSHLGNRREAAGARHGQVDDRHVGLKLCGFANAFRAVARLADDGHVGFGLEHDAQRLPHGGVVVDQDDARGRHDVVSLAGTITRSSVPAPGQLRISSRPP
jgi:hypothetical protein